MASSDLIGCVTDLENFFAIGTGAEFLLGACESFYRPNMGPDELFEVTAQTFMSGVDRDAISGWGAIVYVVTPSGITAKTLKTRMD